MRDWLGRHLAWWPPVLVIAVICTVDLRLNIPTVYGLLAIVPLLVSAVAPPRVVAAWGAVCLLVQSVLGVTDDVYTHSERLTAHTTRLLACLTTTVVGIVLARARLRREARLVQVEAVAMAAQQAILRPLPDRTAGWELAVEYVAASAEASIGGDLYDAVTTPDGLLLLIGDVRGKGLPAVQLATAVLGSFRHLSEDVTDPVTLLRALDRTVVRNSTAEDFVTACVVRIGADGELLVANAGHPEPLLLVHGLATLIIPTHRSPPLGLAADPVGQPARLGGTDRLLLYTDGLIEARRPQDHEPFPLLDLAATTLGSGTPAVGAQALRDAVLRWSGGSLGDDVALLVAQSKT